MAVLSARGCVLHAIIAIVFGAKFVSWLNFHYMTCLDSTGCRLNYGLHAIIRYLCCITLSSTGWNVHSSMTQFHDIIPKVNMNLLVFYMKYYAYHILQIKYDVHHTLDLVSRALISPPPLHNIVHTVIFEQLNVVLLNSQI